MTVTPESIDESMRGSGFGFDVSIQNPASGYDPDTGESATTPDAFPAFFLPDKMPNGYTKNVPESAEAKTFGYLSTLSNEILKGATLTITESGEKAAVLSAIDAAVGLKTLFEITFK